MNVGVVKEIKAQESRVAATPGAVQALVAAGHRVSVEAGAGTGSGFTDDDYAAAGARAGVSTEEAWAQKMVLKVKEPVQSEYRYLRDDLILFAYLHLAADRPLTNALLEAGTAAVAYETVQLPNGALPLLTPMSEVAGRMAIHEGAKYLERGHGGRPAAWVSAKPSSPTGRRRRTRASPRRRAASDLLPPTLSSTRRM